ncbi:uncharacterized protein LOC117780991 [Drosophila innubila]|uniref:uncharacterized protein LOC117780991 n=1 Tax=Drosophila innubila TaxID=198719 RepID=UPI00148E78BC|nr:uncharacterized protein LOC117780991 [Drosophila innubila]
MNKMWNKVLLALALVTLVDLEFVNSLTCYSCNTPQSCQKPWKEVCTDSTANKTSSWLSDIHSNVPPVSHSDEFKCMNLTYYVNSTYVITHEFLGCYHQLMSVD